MSMKKRLSKILIICGIVILIIITAVIIFLKTPALQRVVLSPFLEKKGISLSYHSISGNIIHRLVLTELELTYQQDQRTAKLTADSLYLDYPGLNIIKKRYIFERIRLVNPSLFFRDYSKKEKVKTTAKPSLPEIFSAESVQVINGRLDAFGEKVSELDLLCGLTVRGDTIRARIDTTACLIEERGRLQHLALKATIVDLNKLTFGSQVRLDTTQIALCGNGKIKPVSFDIELSAERLNMDELDRFLSLGKGLKGCGKLTGRIHLEKEEIVAQIDTIDGRFWNIDFKNAKGDLTYSFNRNLLKITDYTGEQFGVHVERVNLTFDFSHKPVHYFGEARFRHFDLAIFSKNNKKRGSSDLSGFLRLDAFGFKSKDLKLDFQVKLSPGEIFNTSLDTAEVRFDVTAEDISFDSTSWLEIGKNRLYLTGRIGFKDTISLDCKASLREFEGILSYFNIKRVSGKGSFSGKISGKTKNPAISGRLLIDELQSGSICLTKGVANLQLKELATGAIGGISVSSHINGLPMGIDSVSAELLLHPGRIEIKPVELLGKDVFSQAVVDVELAKGTVKRLLVRGLSIDMFGEEITIADDVPIYIENGGILFEDANFISSAGKMNLSFSSDTSGVARIIGSIENIQILPLVSLISPELNIGGNCSGNFDITMRRFDLKTLSGNALLSVSPLFFKETAWDSARVKLTTSGDSLILERSYLFGNSSHIEASGGIKLSPSYPLDIRLTAVGSDMSFLGEFVPEIKSLSGDYLTDIRIRGPKDSLTFSGEASLSYGKLYLRSLPDPLENVRLYSRFLGNKILIDTIRAELKTKPPGGETLWQRVKQLLTGKKLTKGEIVGSGGIDLEEISSPRFDIQLSARGLPVNLPQKGIYVRTDADLEIKGEKQLEITGSIGVLEANIVKLELGTSEGEPLKNISLLLEVTAPGNVWVFVQNLIDAEISGQITVSTADGKIILSGEAETISGNVFAYTSTFKIDEGRFIFDNTSEVNPKLDIKASTQVQDVTVYVNVTGTLKEPAIALSSSDAAYSEEKDIIALLALNRPIGDEADTSSTNNLISERTKSIASSFLERQFEDIARKTLGVETFEITPPPDNILDIGSAEFTVGKYITSRLYLRYQSKLNLGEEQEFDIVYRLSRRMTFSGKKDSKGNYHINLNLLWEF